MEGVTESHVKIQMLETEVAKLNQENVDLRIEKGVVLDDLKQKRLEADQLAQELNRVSGFLESELMARALQHFPVTEKVPPPLDQDLPAGKRQRTVEKMSSKKLHEIEQVADEHVDALKLLLRETVRSNEEFAVEMEQRLEEKEKQLQSQSARFEEEKSNLRDDAIRNFLRSSTFRDQLAEGATKTAMYFWNLCMEQLRFCGVEFDWDRLDPTKNERLQARSPSSDDDDDVSDPQHEHLRREVGELIAVQLEN